MREHDLLLETHTEQADQSGQPQPVRMEELESEAVEPEVTSAVQHIGVIMQIGRPAAMADDYLGKIDALGGEDLQLFAAHRALVGMGRDGRSGALRGARG